jgi:hypothetical protein
MVSTMAQLGEPAVKASGEQMLAAVADIGCLRRPRAQIYAPVKLGGQVNVSGF